MKRIVSLVLALSMILSMFTFAFAGTSLKDVKGTKYEAAVEALIELGVVEGYPDGTYLPNNVVTRNELAKLLVVAYGLEPAAEASKGATPFADINAVANHWASGYINVSADYKFVNGYPDGSFKGDSTVTYAEAITMCLRVLGYANEIESKGTWPTNYIAKAQDLKLMEDIEFTSYNDGAKRGDIALLIWNMLRTKMWTVTGESEGDGLQSSATKLMLNVKFADYAYSKEAEFKSYTISADNKEEKAVVDVKIKCNCKEEGCNLSGTYEYEKNDFYTFVSGEEVEVLVNTKDGTLLTMVANGEDKLVEGTIDDLDDANYKQIPASGDYVYAIAEGKTLTATNVINVSSEIVDKLVEKKTSMKYNSTTVNEADYNEKLVLKNGERVSITDLEEGDMLTEVTTKTGTKFYVIGEKTVEGELTKYVVADDQITVAGEKYDVTDTTDYVEDPEKTTITKVNFKGSNVHGKMKGEEVTLRLDPVVGKVVRIEFDGKINGETSDTSDKFFAITSTVEKNNGVYSIALTDENGEDTYTFAEEFEDTANNMWKADTLNNVNIKNAYARVTLNEDNEITAIEIVAYNNKAGHGLIEFTTASGDDYACMTIKKAEYDEDNGRIKGSGDDKINVNDDVIVVKVVYDDEDKKTSVEFEEGLEAIDVLDGTFDVLAIYEVDEDIIFNTAKYVVMYENASDASDKLVVILDENTSINKMDGDKLSVEIDGEDVIFNADSKAALTAEDYNLMVYKTLTNSKNEVTGKFITGLKKTELNTASENHAYVTKTQGTRQFTCKVNTTPVKIDLDTKEVKDTLEDCMFVLVEVTEDEGTQYEVYNYEVLSYDEISIEAYDRIAIRDLSQATTSVEDAKIEGPEVIFIIRGME